MRSKFINFSLLWMLLLRLSILCLALSPQYFSTLSHGSTQFLNPWFWCLLVLLPFLSVCFTFSTSLLVKHFPLRTFFTWGNKKIVAWGEIRWIGRVGHWGHAIFGQKLPNTQCSVGRCTGKSPTAKWANTLKELPPQKFAEARVSLLQQRQLVHWYRWVPRTLT